MLKRVLKDSGIKVFLIDDASPEDAGMLQALYARSPESVEEQANKVYAARQEALGKAMRPLLEEVGGAAGGYPRNERVVQAAMDVWGENHATVRAEKLAARYVAGYGHKSIAIGHAALFFEGVSMAFAKAIQDTPLYDGQEMSSRAVDCASQHYVDPIKTSASADVLAGWRALYADLMPAVAAGVRADHPMRAGEDPTVYDRAVKMRSFDACRGVLPFGCVTQVGWTGTLRHLGDRLGALKFHPLREVRDAVEVALSMCLDKYPNSGFGEASVSGVGTLNEPSAAAAARDAWTREMMADLAYAPDRADDSLPDQLVADTGMIRSRLHYGSPVIRRLVGSRPRGALLPWHLNSLGVAQFEFPLDMGSWRDLQRHRAVVVEPEMLTADYGFEPWYLDQVPADRRADVARTIDDLWHRAVRLTGDRHVRQYYLPMGYRVRARVTAGLPGLVYLLELRSGKTIHPTLRRRVLEMAAHVKSSLPEVAVHVDDDPDDWTVRRGQQIIVDRRSEGPDHMQGGAE